MTDDLDRAVDARLAAYRPERVPPFEVVQARKRSRDRRRGAAAAAAFAAAAVLAGTALPSLLDSGGADQLPPVADGGAGSVFTYRVAADDVAAFRSAGPDALTDLEVCLQYPGLSDGVVLESDPAQYTGRVSGADEAQRFSACVEQVPGMAVTIVAADGPAPVPTPSPSPSGAPLPSPPPSAAPQETVDPDDTYVFSSPTGNLACSLSRVSAVCEVASSTYAPPPKPADCDLDHGAMVAVERTGPGRFLCYGDTGFVQASPGGPASAPGPVLAYGRSVTNGVFTCTSRETGMTCRTVDGAHGFELARSRYRVF